MRRINVDDMKIMPSKIICIGKNYLAHIREMGGSKPLAEPIIFMKPNSAIAAGDKDVTIPAEYGLLHHEVELCFVVSERCKNVMCENARDLISGWAVGLDLTLREKQGKAMKAGGPWTISKCFDGSAIFGQFISTGHSFDPLSLNIQLKLNGEIRHSANTKQMIFSPAEILSFASRFMTIEQGDVFMCGTPEGVGEVKHNDLLEAEVAGLPPLQIKVLRP